MLMFKHKSVPLEPTKESSLGQSPYAEVESDILLKEIRLLVVDPL